MIGVIFLTPFLVYSLLVHRIATDFCILILYPATLLNRFTISTSFLVSLLSIRSYHLQIGISLLPFMFEFLLLPYFFSWLTALVRKPNTVLSKNGENRHSCFIPDFRRNAFSFPSLHMMLAIGFSYITFTMLSLFLQFLISSELLLWKDIKSCQRLFSAFIELSMWTYPWFCLGIVLHLLICTCWNSWILGIKPTWSWCIIY
jgi:hypothetical protein